MNPNDTVRIKLTETGKRMMVEATDALNDSIRKRGAIIWRAKVPEWDADGWTRGQFHTLMTYFDGAWSLGGQMPFTELETNPAPEVKP